MLNGVIKNPYNLIRSFITRKRYSKDKSRFRQSLHKGILSDWEYRQYRLKYSRHHANEYLDIGHSIPDFMKKINGKEYHISAIGLGDKHPDAVHILAMRCLNPDQELIFLFENPQLQIPVEPWSTSPEPLSTYAEWAERYKFRWFTVETIKDLEV